jgi:hypothetical protein
MINNQNRGIRIGIKLSYLADTSELCIYQTRQRSPCSIVYPYECMVAQVVAATTGQIVE